MTPPVDPRTRRARSAISLGAAVAIFGAVLLGYDAPASQAAGGFFEALFGIGRADPYYDGHTVRRHRFSHIPRRIRLAHARRHDMQARRHIAERRKVHRYAAVGEQAHTPGPAVIDVIAPTRGAFELIGEVGSGPRLASVTHAPAAEARIPAQGCPKPCSIASDPAPAPRLEATLSPRDIYADPTLRPGDTIITADGIRILRPGSRFPFKASDFISLAQAGKSHLANRSALNEIERSLKTPPGRVPADF